MNSSKLLITTLIAAAAFSVSASAATELTEDTTVTSVGEYTLASGVTATVDTLSFSSAVNLSFTNSDGASDTTLSVGTITAGGTDATLTFGVDSATISTLSVTWLCSLNFTAGSTKIATATLSPGNASTAGTETVNISSGATLEITTATYGAVNSNTSTSVPISFVVAGTLKITSFTHSSTYGSATFTNNSGTIEIGTYTIGNGTATFSGTSISITEELIQNSNYATINVYAEEATIAKLTTKYSGSIVFGNGTDSMTATVATLSLNNVANSTTYQYDKITIAANATLSVGTITANSSKDNLQITNSGTLNIGTSDESSTSLTYGTVTISGSGTTNIVGTFSTTQSFTNANALNISGAATFSGTTTLTGTLTNTGTTTFSGTTTLSGDVSVEGGTLTFSGTTTGTGTISVEGGTLEVASGVTLSNTISIVLDSYQISTVATISDDSSGTTTALAGSGTISAVTLVASEAVISALVDLGEISFALATQEFNLTADMISISESLASALTNYNYATTYDAGTYTISILAIPEPSMFGILAGISALAIAGTRRRRK